MSLNIELAFDGRKKARHGAEFTLAGANAEPVSRLARARARRSAAV